MAKQREFIKQYDTFTQFVKDIFYSGSYSGAEHDKSRTNFYKLKKNLDFVLKDNFEKSHIRFENLELSCNLLLELYQMKSFTDNDIRLSFAIMIVLNNTDEYFMAADICEMIDDYIPDGVEQRTVERKLNELLKNGYIKSMRKGNKKLYTSKYDILNDFSEEELYLLADMTEFHCNITAPSLCGYYLLQMIKRKLYEKFDTEYESVFLVKHLHLGQIFFDEIIWSLVGYIHNKKIINITLNNRNISYSIYPYKIITDEKSGRRYLFGINMYENAKKPAVFRIDKINQINLSDTECEMCEQEAEEIFIDALSHSFTGVCLKLSELKKVILSFEENMKSIVLRNFKDAVIYEKDDRRFEAEIYVNDVTELKPWLRRFTGKIRVEAGDDDIAVQMSEELKEWRSLYGLN